MQGRVYLNYPPQPFIDFIRESICLFNEREDGEIPSFIICNREEFLNSISEESIKDFETFSFTDKELLDFSLYLEDDKSPPKKPSKVVIQTYPVVGTSQQNIPRNHIWLMKEVRKTN